MRRERERSPPSYSEFFSKLALYLEQIRKLAL
jgi:hypothetical protein